MKRHIKLFVALTALMATFSLTAQDVVSDMLPSPSADDSRPNTIRKIETVPLTGIQAHTDTLPRLFGDYSQPLLPELPECITRPFVGIPEFHFSRNPFTYDFRSDGTIKTWQGGSFSGSGSYSTLPGLLDNRHAAFTLTQHFGNLSLTVAATADRYRFFHGLTDNYGIHGMATWRFNDNVSLTVFGSYYHNNTFFSPAAMPYIGTSRYGGYFNFRTSERFSLDLGVERIYNVYSRQWETQPIITPNIRIRQVEIGLPIGPLILEGIKQWLLDDDYNLGNPTITPPIPPMPPVR